MKIKINKFDALIIVDLQKDFCPGGALAVNEGDKIVPIVNAYIDKFISVAAKVVATRDWHPKKHISFKNQGGLWPEHCVRNTPGAEFHPGLKLPKNAIIISKATKRNKEAYSGFVGTNLKKILKSIKTRRLFICGLATDYCVKFTVLDALKYSFTTFFLSDASKGVDMNTTKNAISEMLTEGAILISYNDIIPFK